MARAAEAVRLASSLGGGFQPEPETSCEGELVLSGFLRAFRDSTPPSQQGKCGGLCASSGLLPKELGGYGSQYAEASRSAVVPRELFQPEPEKHARRRLCPVERPKPTSGRTHHVFREKDHADRAV